MLAAWVAMLLLAGGWFLAKEAAAASAQEPEPTTVSTPTTTPEPDPAPIPPPAAPAPKPKPKPAPAPPRPRPQPTAPAPPPVSSPPSPAPAATRPVVRQRPVAQPKRATRPRVARKRRAPIQSPRMRPPTIREVAPKRSSGPVDVTGAVVGPSSGDSSKNLLLLSVIGLAIACLGLAAIPWALVPLRISYHLAVRQLDLTLAGVGLLVAAGMLFFFTHEG